MRMFKARFLPLFAVLFACSAIAADAGFAGTWKGEFKGRHYLTLTVADGTPPRITMLTAHHIRVNGDGEIDEVDGPVQNEDKVTETKVEGGKLRFKTKDEDGEELEFEMRLTSDGADLQMVGAPIEMKPWRLRRS